MQLTNTIEKDFYSKDNAENKSNEIDIIALIESNPELKKEVLMKLLEGIR